MMRNESFLNSTCLPPKTFNFCEAIFWTSVILSQLCFFKPYFKPVSFCHYFTFSRNILFQCHFVTIHFLCNILNQCHFVTTLLFQAIFCSSVIVSLLYFFKQYFVPVSFCHNSFFMQYFEPVSFCHYLTFSSNILF